MSVLVDYLGVVPDETGKATDVSFELNVQTIQFIQIFVSTFLINLPIETQISSYEQYKPPLINRDIPILVQSFLF